MLALVSCTQDVESIDDRMSDDIVNTNYSIFTNEIKDELNSHITALGWTTKCHDGNDGILDKILAMPLDTLQRTVNIASQRGLIDSAELAQDSILDEFISRYSTEDFVQLNQALETYLQSGGHNIPLLKQISNQLPQELIDGYVYICAYSDVMASKDLWEWLSVKETRVMYNPGDQTAMELSCRIAFWNKLRLISLQASSEYLVGLLSGPMCPDITALVTAANVLNATGAALEYYACCRGAISL